MILRDVRARQAISSRAEAFELTGADHPRERASVNAECPGIAGSQDGALRRKAQDFGATRSASRRHLVHNVELMLAFCRIAGAREGANESIDYWGSTKGKGRAPCDWATR